MATAPIQQPIQIGTGLQNGSPTFAGGPESTLFKETAGQSWKAGDLIYLDSNGTLAICTYGGGANSNLCNSKIAGQAIKAASGTTGQKVFFKPIRPDYIFEMNVYHGTLGSAITAQTQLGKVYGLKRVNNKVVVAIDETVEDATYALGRVKVIGFSTKDTLGDTYGRVLVQFVPTSSANDGNPIEPQILQLG